MTRFLFAAYIKEGGIYIRVNGIIVSFFISARATDNIVEIHFIRISETSISCLLRCVRYAARHVRSISDVRFVNVFIYTDLYGSSFDT